jgi:hypothetical protein
MEDNIMTEMVLDIQKVPETIFSKISTRKVKFFEENGIITLTPFFDEKPRFDHLIGIFSDGKISVDDFLEEKQQERKLEI